MPERFTGPNEDPVPRFLQVDFGLVRTPDGGIEPRLVELQAFASLYGFQRRSPRPIATRSSCRPSLSCYLGGLDRASYHALVGDAIVGGHDPAEVVLMEIEPRQAEDVARFRRHRTDLGRARGRHVGGAARRTAAVLPTATARLTPIRRIYNRVIPDELERKGIQLPFDYRDDLDVEWAGHPAWFFRISKFSIPLLRHPSVPRTWFLHELDEPPGGSRATIC